MSDAKKYGWDGSTCLTCHQPFRLAQRVQELEKVLVLAEHKIDQYLQGQYPEGNSLGNILKAIRAALAGAKESDAKP